MTRPLIQLENVDVTLNGCAVLRGINWRLRPREHWAILGGNGSGKTTLLRLIRGELWPAPGRGRRVYDFDGEPQTSAVGIKEQIALVSPELQQRYLRQEWTLTAQQVVQTGFFNSDYLHQKLNQTQQTRAGEMIRLLGIGHLRRRNVQQLSTGELRRVLIARALAGSPRVLVLDEVCDGLDASTRVHLLQVIERLSRTSIQILHATHRAEEIVPATTHMLTLENGTIAWQGKRRPVISRPVLSKAGRKSSHASRGAGEVPLVTNASEILFHIQNTAVFLERRKVLRDLHWEMRADQNWAVFGPNGAGKSTFLKLINGDLYPALGCRITRFDLTDRSTVWELRRRLGCVSPGLQAAYQEHLTGAEVIASGFFSSVGLMDKPSRAQMKKVRTLIDSFGLGMLAGRLVQHMSYGEFRQILLLRALVHEPRVLICDEPFDGLDAPAKAEFTRALQHVAHDGTRLLIATHHLDDLPDCITHALRFDHGRVQWQGRFSDALQQLKTPGPTRFRPA